MVLISSGQKTAADTDLKSPQGILKVSLFGLVVGGIFGMMGAGGSMILKPMLYFGFDVSPFKHTIFNAYVILVFLALFGVVRGQAKGLVVWRDVAMLGVFASGFGTALGSYLAALVSSRVQLLTFGCLVVGVAAYMLWPEASRGSEKPAVAGKLAAKAGRGLAEAAAVAVVVGMLSGFVGVGGGFMLTPLLCHLGHGMNTAVPTSQAVICLSSCFGIYWYAYWYSYELSTIHGVLVLSFIAAGFAGLAFSDYLGSLMSKAARQSAFAVLLVVIGAGTIVTDPYVMRLVA